MAVTSIHPIRSTLNLAIDYIINPEKTERSLYIDGFECTPQMAYKEFEWTWEKNHCDHFSRNGSRPILAQHIIQSFAPEDNVTPELAQEIGKKLMDELCGGKFEYVIATHVDKAHIHNHIIVNHTSFVTDRSFETELNRGGAVWKKIRDISDRLCEENQLSVIRLPEIGKGKSYHEWEQHNQGNSWKSKIKKSIDECVLIADSFGHFLELMKQRGYEIKMGKHIAFRAEGQERFTRGKTLGWYYDEEHLRNRIANYVVIKREREEWKQADNENTYKADNYIGRAIDLTIGKFQNSEGLRRWGMLQNMKNTSKLINALSEKNINSPEELDERISTLYDTQLDVADEIKQTEKKIKKAEKTHDIVSDYLNFLPLNNQYKKERNPDKFYREHEAELRRFEFAKKDIKSYLNPNGKLPNLHELEKSIAALKKKKNSLMEQRKDIQKEIAELSELRKSVNEFIRDERYKARSENIN